MAVMPRLVHFADPNQGLGAQLSTGNSRGTPGTQQARQQQRQRGVATGPDHFAELVTSLAQKACSADGDTIIWEMPVGATSGFTCVAPAATATTSSGASVSLAGSALAAESSIP